MNVTMDHLPLFGVFLASVIVTLLATELGVRLATWRKGKLAEGESVATRTAAAASLSLLGFMLAMAFGAAASRYHELKNVTLEEANAIGTTFVRVDLLPQSDRAEIRQLLYDYVTLQVDITQAGAERRDESNRRRSDALQQDLWSRAVALAEQEPTPISALFVQALNELIDMRAKRLTLGLHYRLPESIWLVLGALTVLAMAMAGYEIGVSGGRRVIATTLLGGMAFSAVLTFVVALDRHDHRVSSDAHIALFNLQKEMHRSMQPH